ncbi:retrovirus-related Pol polyprotein from transposon 412 [Trichonephila clavipes]|uniref:RNA-directed DNA polymerase n=1 Tax=Trichonephila clavipes TaxID=2585209 RepID=A0A8X6S582_TRICX|nr:retrovirus-related Pol polyprotein from transposon 412 [Trichonephila clavipes]
MKGNDVIEPLSSLWASPTVLVRKKDGSTRSCVDYRRLNDVTKKDSYPLPKIDDTLDTLTGNTWFSVLDLKSGYWQVELHPHDKKKTAFTTGEGLWQFKVIPFGLCNCYIRTLYGNSPRRTFVRGLPGLSRWHYHREVLRRRTSEKYQTCATKKLKEANLKLSPSKCHLFWREVTYLGHIISAEGVRTDPDKILVVKDWNCPTDVHQLQSFLGICTYYRKFVKNFSTIARTLHKLTEAKQKFTWTVDCNNTFNKLKDVLTSAPILAYPEIGKQFILDTDASHESIGAVLSQDIDGQERVIAYFSKCLSKPKRNYCVTRKELLAIVKAVNERSKAPAANRSCLIDLATEF